MVSKVHTSHETMVRLKSEASDLIAGRKEDEKGGKYLTPKLVASSFL